MRNKRFLFYTHLMVVFVLFYTSSNAQTDTLIFDNGEIVIGEIKLLKKGTLTIETAYSDSDFLIDWAAVRSIRSDQKYIITVSDGRRLYAGLNSIGNGDEVIMKDGQKDHMATLLEIVYFKPIDTTFWDRFSVRIDFGLNSTKANNLTQFSSSLAAGYLTKPWALNGSLNRVFSRQDSAQDTKRTDANVRFLVFLQKDWYVFVSNDFLQNDEQKLALRSNTKLGLASLHSTIMNCTLLYLLG